jgi:hypothetical protein
MAKPAGIALAALLFAAGCDDDAQPASTPIVADGGGADAGAGGDAAAPDTGTPLVPLTDWVHDLVTGFGPMSAPDTVDDKHIKDTDDPAAFDSLLQ